MANFKYTESETTFINPYNFVPINYKKTPTEDIEASKNRKELITGVIKCSIQTKTPIAILDTALKIPERIEKKQKDKIKIIEHYKYPFMKDQNGAYMIPAASIRGMVRNVYETLTDSCFSTLKDNTLLTTRSKNAFQAGLLLLEDGKWKLYSATRYMLKIRSYTGKGNNSNKDVWDEKICPTYRIFYDKETKEKYIELKAAGNKTRIYSGKKILMEPLKDLYGREVFYTKTGHRGNSVNCARVAAKVKSDDETNPGKFKSGYLVLGEQIYNKHHESVFCKSEEIILSRENIEAAMAGLEETLKIYCDSAINRNLEEGKMWYPAYQRMKKEGCIPVWYSEKKGMVYLSMAAMGRMAYRTTMNDLVDKKKPCDSRKAMCDACRLFGMTGKKESVGSRIRFTDATYTSQICETEVITLTELGSPRTSYMPFYADVNDRNFGGKNKPGYDDGIGIKGRKFYWHANNWEQINNKIKKDNRNATVEVLKTAENEAFTFKIYFDEITYMELQKLIFSLNFWENDKNGNMCHKIGHGKPIGLGSIKVTVDDICKRTFSEEKGYEIKSVMKEYMEETEAPFKVSDKLNKTLQSLLKICNFKNAVDTCYPYVEKPDGVTGGANDFASHQWFKENMSAGLKGHNHDLQYLPKILDESQELKVYKAEPGRRN